MPPPVSLPLEGTPWEFFETRSARWLSARVPGCIHTDLRRHGVIPDPFHGSNERGLEWIERQDWRYRTVFEAPDALFSHDNIELVAEGLDTVAAIILNGEPVARTENMFTGYRIPVKEMLRAGRNELHIDFANPLSYINARRQPDDFPEWNDPIGGSSHIRKQQCSFGWDWGPRFPTSGIYRGIRLEAWSRGRLEHVRLRQTHGNGAVALDVMPLSAGAGSEAESAFHARLCFEGVLIAEARKLPGDPVLRLDVPHPQLWWPNGHGAQPLYDLEVDLLGGRHQEVLDTWRRRIGLRTIVLDQHPDQWGKSFQFVVNGRPIFAKGANWIPAHSFVSEVTRADYDDLLTSAAAAHINMMRVWGGGIYEDEAFYDLCDAKGLLVWQDFMFSCALYPGREDFLRLVETEAEYQVRRLSHRACLALWCGNNEVEMMVEQIAATRERTAAFETLYYDLLPAAVEHEDGTTSYWPGSPHNPEGWRSGINSETGGDAHFWEVWHERKPVKAYEEKKFRFCSEFGMQSYSSPEVAAAFCPPDEFNVFSPAMENHQKNSAGNQIILDYISRLYRFPKDYASLSYLSQLNQAYCLKVGVEHYRRLMPRCMGALYWQLNDCWPVFSWSSIEFGGKWKALHYAAKRFFAPALVSAHVLGDERVHIGNRVVSTIHDLDVYTVYDGIAESRGHLAWELRHLDGRRLEHGGKEVLLRHGESVRQERLDFAEAIEAHGAAVLYLHLLLTIDGHTASEDTVLLTAPRFLNLRRAPLEVRVAEVNPGDFQLEFSSRVYQYGVHFELSGKAYRASDNFFHLHPHWPRRVRVRLTGEETCTAADMQAAVQTMSLVDSY